MRSVCTRTGAEKRIAAIPPCSEGSRLHHWSNTIFYWVFNGASKNGVAESETRGYKDIESDDSKQTDAAVVGMRRDACGTRLERRRRRWTGDR